MGATTSGSGTSRTVTHTLSVLVEDKPGVKSPERIRAFLAAAKQSHLESAQ